MFSQLQFVTQSNTKMVGSLFLGISCLLAAISAEILEGEIFTSKLCFLFCYLLSLNSVDKLRLNLSKYLLIEYFLVFLKALKVTPLYHH